MKFVKPPYVYVNKEWIFIDAGSAVLNCVYFLVYIKFKEAGWVLVYKLNPTFANMLLYSPVYLSENVSLTSRRHSAKLFVDKQNFPAREYTNEVDRISE